MQLIEIVNLEKVLSHKKDIFVTYAYDSRVYCVQYMMIKQSLHMSEGN